MKTYIALFRGINVGGRNTLPMKDLAAILGDLACHSSRTYIQSGNAAFQITDKDAAELPAKIAKAIKVRFGFEPDLQVLGLGAMERIAASNPFPEAEAEPKSLHIYFLESIPKNADLCALERFKAVNEQFAVQDRAFYLHAPDGIGRSKLAANVERLLGVSATSRNWRSVCKVIEMARELE